MKHIEGLTAFCGRAPCATSLWLYEQKQAELSKQELLDQKVGFDETLYVDGDWVKNGKESHPYEGKIPVWISKE